MHRNKSFFIRIIKYFIVVICIPIIFVVFLQIETEKIIKNQIEMTGKNILSQFYKTMEVIMDEMYADTFLLTLNQECNRLALFLSQNKDVGYRTYKVQKSLLELDEKKYEDVFVYFPTDGRIISKKSSFQYAEEYYHMFYDNGNEDNLERFNNVLECTNRQPQLFGITNQEGKNVMCMAVRRHYVGDPQMDYTAVLVLSDGFIEQIIKEYFVLQGSGEFLVLDQVGASIWPHENYKMSLEDEEEATYVIFEMEVDSKSYISQAEKSQVFDGYYAYLLPEQYYWQQLQTINFLYGLSIVMCIVVGSIVIYKLTIKTYEPIKNILGKIQEELNVEYDSKSKTEFEYMLSYWYEEREKNRKLNVDNKKYRSMTQKYNVIQLFSGNTEVLQENREELSERHYCVAIIEIEKIEYDKLLSFVLENVFSELFYEYEEFTIVKILEKKYGMLINLGEEYSEDNVLEVLKIGIDFFENNIELSLAIGMSSICNGAQQVPEAYKEAEKALRHGYATGTVAKYEEIQNLKHQTVRISPQKEQDKGEDTCQLVRSYIAENYMNSELSISVLSEYFHVSGIQLSRLFKECYNMSILEYISYTRVQAAKKQLESTQNGIAKIAEQCGFLSSTVFIRTFKKYEGITPGMYQKLNYAKSEKV